tara:strand:- start:1141 stop:1683 length:543 start_codon:yes stop_codon:yes gene_type:complete
MWNAKNQLVNLLEVQKYGSANNAGDKRRISKLSDYLRKKRSKRIPEDFYNRQRTPKDSMESTATPGQNPEKEIDDDDESMIPDSENPDSELSKLLEELDLNKRKPKRLNFNAMGRRFTLPGREIDQIDSPPRTPQRKPNPTDYKTPPTKGPNDTPATQGPDMTPQTNLSKEVIEKQNKQH